MRNHITDEQFYLASKLCKNMSDVIERRDEIIRLERDSSHVFRGSEIWEAIELMKFCLQPSYEVCDTWRLHTWLFTGHHPYHVSAASAHGDDFMTSIDPQTVKLRSHYLKLIDGIPSDCIVRPPDLLGENGWKTSEGLVNSDVIAIQRHVSSLYSAGIIEKFKSKEDLRILEIGGGYGGLALALKHVWPQASYDLVDIPESLVFAAVYLGINSSSCVSEDSIVKFESSCNSGRGSFRFFADYLTDYLQGPFDLVINTGSFGEMSVSQVKRYAELISAKISPEGFLFERNQNTFVPVSAILSETLRPISAGGQSLWVSEHSHFAPVQISKLRKAYNRVSRLLSSPRRRG